jgi:hypothetical protein
MPKRSIRLTDAIDPRIQSGPSAASISGHPRMPHRRAGVPLDSAITALIKASRTTLALWRVISNGECDSTTDDVAGL